MAAALSHLFQLLCVASPWGARAFVRPNSLSCCSDVLIGAAPRGPLATKTPLDYAATLIIIQSHCTHQLGSSGWEREREREMRRKNPEKCMSNSERLSARISKVLQKSWRRKEKIIAHSASRVLLQRVLTTHFRLFVATSASQRLHLGVKHTQNTQNDAEEQTLHAGWSRTLDFPTHCCHWYFLWVEPVDEDTCGYFSHPNTITI